jgi:hypothetical protein
MIVDFGFLIVGKTGRRPGGRPVAATRVLFAGFRGILVFRAHPADEAALFLGGALVIEGDKPPQQIIPCLLLSWVLGLAVLSLDRKVAPAIRL